VYRLVSNEHEGQEYTRFVERLHWQPLDHLDPFTKLEQRKEEILETAGEQNYYDADDVESIVADRVDETKRETEAQLIADLYEHTDMTQRELGEALDVSEYTINQRLNS